MEILTLAELQAPDERTLKFTPFGLGGRMDPEHAAEFQQKVVGQYELSEAVPETTRLSFERLRTIFSYGVLNYELFTVAGDMARLVVEQALRDRFVPFYGGTVDFTDGQGKPQQVTAANFEQLYQAIRGNDGRVRSGWYLIRADSAIPVFSHLRQVLSGVPGHDDAGECGICPVETIGSGSLTSMLRKAGKLGTDITPRPVPNARVTISWIPRYNEILSEGSWTYPPEAASTSA